MARRKPIAPRGDVVKVSGTNAGQRARWRELAGRSLSAWMRQAADLAADGSSFVLTSDQCSRLEEALLTLRGDMNRGAGNNLNQIAQALNTDLRSGLGADGAAHGPALLAAAASIEGFRCELRAALSILAR